MRVKRRDMDDEEFLEQAKEGNASNRSTILQFTAVQVGGLFAVRRGCSLPGQPRDAHKCSNVGSREAGSSFETCLRPASFFEPAVACAWLE